MKINALGFIEVWGLVAGIEAADAMLKTADVRLLAVHKVDPALITIEVEGDLAACREAVNAGREAATRIGQVIATHVIGRPDVDTEQMVLTHIPNSINRSSMPNKQRSLDSTTDVHEMQPETVVTAQMSSTEKRSIVATTKKATVQKNKATQLTAKKPTQPSKQQKAAKQGQALAQAAKQWADSLIGEMSTELNDLRASSESVEHGSQDKPSMSKRSKPKQ